MLSKQKWIKKEGYRVLRYPSQTKTQFY